MMTGLRHAPATLGRRSTEEGDFAGAPNGDLPGPRIFQPLFVPPGTTGLQLLNEQVGRTRPDKHTVPSTQPGPTMTLSLGSALPPPRWLRRADTGRGRSASCPDARHRK